jgi:hypothetical protein
MTGCCGPSWPPTTHPHRYDCERRCTPLTFTRQKPSTRLAYCQNQPETQDNCQRSSDQGSLAVRA